jgi:predicted Zn-dependent protease
MSRIVAPALVLMLAACGVGPEDQLETARGHLAQGAWAEAAAAASKGLAAGPQGSTAWRLELTALEGEARGGRTADVLVRLERLAGSWPAQVSGPLYVQTAGQLREGGDPAGAISVLDAGAKRFPQDPGIAQAIAQSKATGTAQELDRLRSLGYVE